MIRPTANLQRWLNDSVWSFITVFVYHSFSDSRTESNSSSSRERLSIEGMIQGKYFASNCLWSVYGGFSVDRLSLFSRSRSLEEFIVLPDLP